MLLPVWTNILTSSSQGPVVPKDPPCPPTMVPRIQNTPQSSQHTALEKIKETKTLNLSDPGLPQIYVSCGQPAASFTLEKRLRKMEWEGRCSCTQ